MCWMPPKGLRVTRSTRRTRSKASLNWTAYSQSKGLVPPLRKRGVKLPEKRVKSRTYWRKSNSRLHNMKNYVTCLFCKGYKLLWRPIMHLFLHWGWQFARNVVNFLHKGCDEDTQFRLGSQRECRIGERYLYFLRNWYHFWAVRRKWRTGIRPLKRMC